jgi:hypothetical protein
MSSGSSSKKTPSKAIPQRPATPQDRLSPRPETPPTERKKRIASSRTPRHYSDKNPQGSPSAKGETADPEDLPDAPSEDPSAGESSSSSSESSDSDDDMSELVFDGKPGTLDDILTHCQVTFLAKSKKFTSDSAKCGHLAAKFRGKPLTWLTKQLKENPTTLESWEYFTSKLRRDFEVSDDTKRLSADRRLKTLVQKGSAQSFAIEFDELTDILGFEDKAKQDAFLTRLKPEVRRQLIGDDSSSYSDLRDTAIRYDEELFALRNPRSRRPGKKGKGTGPSGPGKN